MLGKSIDLHMHSYYSDDGEFTPEELVRKCSDSGIKVMAIADHNSVRANARGELEAAKAGITYIPAIEIDCTFRGVNLHVLGYGIGYESQDFAEIEDNIAAQGAVASRQMLQATRKMGFQVSEQEMEELQYGGVRIVYCWGKGDPDADFSLRDAQGRELSLVKE